MPHFVTKNMEQDLDTIFSNLSFGKDEPEEEKTVQVKITREKHFLRRVNSELHLEEQLPWHFENGYSYHCISFGDVDSLTYLRAIVKQQKIKYVAISTWRLASTDAEEIGKWLDKGYIERCDFYIGEISLSVYPDVYKYLLDKVSKNGGRVAVFKNHSKIMAGFGEKYDFAIVSSANINTNPRCENTTITVNTELARFYKDFYDGIKSFNHDCDDWTPYKI